MRVSRRRGRASRNRISATPKRLTLLALLLDTRDVPAEDREASILETFTRSDVPRTISLTAPLTLGTTRIEAWTFGSTMLFSPTSPGLRVVRSPALEPMEPIIALLVQNRGTALFTEDGQSRQLLPGQLTMARPTSSNEFLLNGTASAFQVPFEEVGLTFDTARLASDRLPASPLFSLVSQHLLSIRHTADELQVGLATGMDIGAATTHLVRALLVSAVEDERDSRSALAEAMWPRILAFVRQHLADPELSPAAIAREHNISIRYLYKLCEAADVRLMEWIIHQRLEGARTRLMDHNRPQPSIAWLAKRWGFKDASHFSTRFRKAYDMSPRELLEQSQRIYRDQS